MTQAPSSPQTLYDFIAQSTQEPLYYSEAWQYVISKLYGYRVFALTTSDVQGQITGYLPLCEVQSPITGKRLISFSFSDHCPPLTLHENATHELIDKAVELAQRRGVKCLELRAGSNQVLEQRSDFVAQNLYVRWYLSLMADPDQLWKSLRKPVQRQVTKAQKSGVQVRFAQEREEMRHYYRLHLANRTRKLGMPAQSLPFFFALWDTFAATGQIQLLLAEYEGHIIAGMILMTSGTCMRLGYAASDERYLALAPNNLLNWEAIKWGCLQGYTVYDLGRTARDNEGLMEYKRRWGALQEPLPYYYYPQAAGLAATSEQSWKYRALTSTWSKLPLSVAGPLGSLLYKHLG